MVHDGLHVFVTAPGQAHDHQVVVAQVGCPLHGFGQCVSGFQCRDDAFEQAALMEGIQRFVIGDADVLDAFHFVQEGVLRADTRVVQASRDRMRVSDLPVAILEQVGTVAVQHARYAAIEAGRVLVGIHAVTARFNADDFYAGVIEERMEQAHGVGAAAHAGDQAVRQTTFLLLHLLFGFLADDGLEITHHCRIRMRTCHSADQVEGVIDVGHPVTQGFVHRIFQGAGAGSDWYDFSAQQLHAEHVGLLTLDVGRAHVDHARQAKARRDGSGSNAVHARAGFRNQAFLPMRLASNTWPMQLLILCAPVWFSSSRLK